MCNVCRFRTCPPPCPNTNERAVGVCAYCGGPVFDYEPRLREAEGRLFHAECLEELTTAELLELFGVEVFEEE